MLCTGPYSGDTRACAAGGHPSRTPLAPLITPCMQQRPTNMQCRHSSPSGDSQTSIMHARKPCTIDVWISAFTRQVIRSCAATAMRSRAHLLSCPLACRQRHAQSRQGERGRIIGPHGMPWRNQASAILRARARALNHRPFGPASSPWRPPAWQRSVLSHAWLGGFGHRRSRESIDALS